jgi:hypothetical protein
MGLIRLPLPERAWREQLKKDKEFSFACYLPPRGEAVPSEIVPLPEKKSADSTLTVGCTGVQQLVKKSWRRICNSSKCGAEGPHV